MKNTTPTMETIKNDVCWLGEILDVRALDNYTIVELKDHDDNSIKYTGYYVLNFLEKDEKWVKTHYLYDTFDKAVINLICERNNASRMNEAIFRILGI